MATVEKSIDVDVPIREELRQPPVRRFEALAAAVGAMEQQDGALGRARARGPPAQDELVGSLAELERDGDLAPQRLDRRRAHDVPIPIPAWIAPVCIVTPRNPPITMMNSAMSIAPNRTPEL